MGGGQATGSMRGRRVVITGATSGIGEATAIALAQAGADLVLIARNPAKATATVARIEQAGCRGSVHVVDGDLASLASVRRAAQAVSDGGDPVDVLINNAGAAPVTSRRGADGYDELLATNYLGPFLLTHLLLGPLHASTSARIVNVASMSHWFIRRFDPERFERVAPYDGFVRAGYAYAVTKLLDVLMADELARRLHGTTITANSLCPGYVATAIGRESTPAADIERMRRLRLLRAPADGARTSVYLASADEVEGVTGRFFASTRLVQHLGRARTRRDPAIARRTYERTCALLDVDPIERGPARSEDTTAIGAVAVVSAAS